MADRSTGDRGQARRERIDYLQPEINWECPAVSGQLRILISGEEGSRWTRGYVCHDRDINTAPRIVFQTLSSRLPRILFVNEIIDDSARKYAFQYRRKQRPPQSFPNRPAPRNEISRIRQLINVAWKQTIGSRGARFDDHRTACDDSSGRGSIGKLCATDRLITFASHAQVKGLCEQSAPCAKRFSNDRIPNDYAFMAHLFITDPIYYGNVSSLIRFSIVWNLI